MSEKIKFRAAMEYGKYGAVYTRTLGDAQFTVTLTAAPGKCYYVTIERVEEPKPEPEPVPMLEPARDFNTYEVVFLNVSDRRMVVCADRYEETKNRYFFYHNDELVATVDADKVTAVMCIRWRTDGKSGALDE